MLRYKLAVNRFASQQLSKFDIRGTLRKYNLKIGDQYQNFTLKNLYPSKDFNLIYYDFQHNTTNARYVHLSQNRLINEAALLFYTPANDDSGVSNIVHRICQAGSIKYPVRDAWSHMHRRSLQPRHLSPILGPDYMYFPIQSSIREDFYQLVDLTFEQVFRPMKREVDYLIEGVRLQFVGQELEGKGEVYNEMKMNFTNGDFLMNEWSRKVLLKGSIYEHSSGGRIESILKSKYEDVLEYHDKYISGNNCIIVTGGDLDLLEHLGYFDNKLNELRDKKQQNMTRLYSDDNYKCDRLEQKLLTLKYTSQDNEKQIGLAFKGPDIKENSQDYIELHLLSFLLHEIEGIGFNQILDQSTNVNGYCSKQKNYGLSTDLRNSIFMMGIRGNNQDVVYQFKETLNHQLDSLINEDIIHKMIDRIQMYRQCQLSDLLIYLIHNMEPQIFLNQSSILKKLSKNGEQLIQKYFNNENYLCVKLIPDKDAYQQFIHQEKSILQEINKQLSEKQIEQITNSTELVKEQQEQIQTVDKLPIIDITKILPSIIQYNKQTINLNYDLDCEFYQSIYPQQSTVIMSINVAHLSQSFVKSLHLLQFILPELFNMKLSTNDLKASIHNDQAFILQFDFINSNLESAFTLLTTLLSDPQYDHLPKLSEIITIKTTELSTSITSDPLTYAIDYARKHDQSNLSQLRNVASIAVELLRTYNAKPLLNQICDSLIDLYLRLMNKNLISFQVYTNPHLQRQITMQLNILLSSIKIQFDHFLLDKAQFLSLYQNQSNQSEQLQQEEHQRKLVVIPIQSNFVVENITTNQKFGDKDCPTFHVLAQLLNDYFLLQYTPLNVYQSSSIFCPISGCFTFFTYRDPNTVSSYLIFEKAIHDLIDYDDFDEQLIGAKISLLRRIQQKKQDNQLNLNKLLYGIEEEEKGNYIQALMLVSHEDIKSGVNQLLKKLADGESSQVIFGRQDINLEQMIKRGWKIEQGIDGISLRESQYRQTDREYYEYPESLY